MDKFNSNNFNINKFNNPNAMPNLNNAGIHKGTPKAPMHGGFSNFLNVNPQGHFRYPSFENMQMTLFLNNEKNAYMKDIMNLPKDMKEILALLQNTTQNSGKLATNFMSTNINLSALAELFQKSGKEAIAKMISTMAEASKMGLGNTSELKDMMKLINASISVSGQDNQTQAVKTLMLLYLPWLPLQEGKDFELEIENSENGGNDDDAILTILISTVNYGNIKILVIKKTASSFDVLIKCLKNFPQAVLKEKILEENKQHSIQTDIMFEEKDDEKSENKKNHQAKVSMSNLKDVTPYLLVLSNTLIKYIILLDNKA